MTLYLPVAAFVAALIGGVAYLACFGVFSS